MKLYDDDIKVTMTGLSEAMAMINDAHDKVTELMELMHKIYDHSLAMGIEINRPLNESTICVDNVIALDQP